jgi:hypothetical protein
MLLWAGPQVLSPPESLTHLRQDDAALAPTDCLVGLLRAQSTVSAMVTLPAPDQGGTTGEEPEVNAVSLLSTECATGRGQVT